MPTLPEIVSATTFSAAVPRSFLTCLPSCEVAAFRAPVAIVFVAAFAKGLKPLSKEPNILAIP